MGAQLGAIQSLHTGRNNRQFDFAEASQVADLILHAHEGPSST